MKTTKMTVVMGICEGYFHENGSNQDFNELYLQIAGKVFEETGIYISAVSKETRTLYNIEWGCPKGGEITYEITSTANPEFVVDIELWKEVALKIVTTLKTVLKQSTVTIEFSEVDLIYIK